MQDSVAKYQATSNNVSLLQAQQQAKEQEYQEVVQDLLAIKDINAQRDELLTCLSTKGCTNVADSLKNVIPQMRAFLQLQKNEGEKMAFDQKKILANVNEYLLKGSNQETNGVITSIVFGNIAPVEAIDNLIQIPITLTIDFADKNGLLSFIYNVETTLSPRYPMLYTVNSVNYDIVKYQEKQTVSIELI